MNKNQRLMELAQDGSFFLYDLDALSKHAQNLNKSACKLFFACKANPLSSILHTLDKANIGFDVASGGELHQVLSLGIPGSRIIMTGPAKPEWFIRLGLEHKISAFVIESPFQLQQLEKLTKEYEYQPSVLLRLQLKWEREGRNILGGEKITPFGMDLKTAEALLSNLSLPFLGFHVFQWGNILSLEELRAIWEHTIKICKTLRTDFQVLDVGGGLGIPYNQSEQPLEWQGISELIEELKATYKLPELWLEMGRYMTGPYGQYVTSVVDIKETYDQKILVLEGGINHLARPALISQAFPAQLLREV